MGSFVCDVDGTRRNNTFLVLRFDEHGKHVYLEMTRNDILQTIRQAEQCPSVASTNLPPTTKERSGSISPLGAYCDLQPVHMRDLRQLDESFSESNETSIVVRKQAILINADPIRSIIMRNATLILVPDGADSLLSMLIKDFHDCVEIKDSTTPYEFRALEAILDTLSRLLDDEYDHHAAEIGEMLDSLVSVRIISGELETMRLMKNSMNAFEAQVDSVRRALMELLDNEEDLRLLYLTKLSQEPSLIYDLGSFDPEEVEILLESYMKDIYTTRTKSELLQHRVQSTESLITMKLDYARNYLLALQLIFSLAGVGLGVGTLIAGIFGMNLTMGIPNTVAYFWWVDAAIVASCIGIIWGGIMYFRHQGLMIST
ncbi:hypothetical protein Poli38472_002160 [Pythium oligandrum]|uniref:Magnesium transporter n=1 Tax=Pythium oligandrum TaxID=41045 RepID=A0A8K1CGQ0_PYTOL|nr:hypothetical protein Poli38472_002160 [Pythium oligandrum]|eukprot:TMW63219.1 hypothetical protein Poli38472_002160 [Pythium oligandrum]